MTPRGVSGSKKDAPSLLRDAHFTDGTTGHAIRDNRGAFTATGEDVRTASVLNVSAIPTNPGSCLANATGKRYVGVQCKARQGALWSDGQAERDPRDVRLAAGWLNGPVLSFSGALP